MIPIKLDNFWNELSIFSFERAKEMADKEKETALKTQSSHLGSSGFNWVILSTALSQLAFAEKAYTNLSFLAPKGFLRKDVNVSNNF